MWLSAGLFLAIIYSTSVLALPVVESETQSFAANISINAQEIFDAARQAKKIVAKFRPNVGSKKTVKIFNDWDKLGVGATFGFIADMDVDCDGVDFMCPHNPDGQPQTTFGAISATRVPFYVIPDSLFRSHKVRIKPNALGMIICGNNIFYGIMADTNGDTPEVIGEASILMAQTCFPGEHLDGGKGHGALDVLYVVFGDTVPTGVGDQTIDIAALKRLGDQSATQLAEALKVIPRDN